MSRFSEAVKRIYGRVTGKQNLTATQIFKQLTGQASFELIEFTKKVVLALDYIDADDDSRINKREVVTAIVKGAVKVSGIDNVPTWVINSVVEDIVRQLRIPDFDIKIPAIPTGMELGGIETVEP